MSASSASAASDFLEPCRGGGGGGGAGGGAGGGGLAVAVPGVLLVLVWSLEEPTGG